MENVLKALRNEPYKKVIFLRKEEDVLGALGNEP